MVKRCVAIILCLVAFNSRAQVSDFLKRQQDKAAKMIKEKGTKGALSRAEAERAAMDSADFNFAISVIDNSGMMNVREKGEVAKKIGIAGTTFMLKDDNETTPEQRTRSALEAAQMLYKARLFKMAEARYLVAQAQFEAEGQTGHINYSKVFADLGLLYATQGKYNSASQYTEQALEIRQQTLGENSIGYAASVNNRAVLYQDLAFFNEAEKDFAVARNAVKAIKTENSLEYAIVLNNESILFAEVGRFDDAIANLNKAVAILEADKRRSANIQVGLRSNLALLYQRTGKYAEAESNYLKLEKDLGSSSPYYAGVLNNLALLYVQMNKPDKVEDYLKRAAAVYKSQFGEQSPNYAKVLADQGWFYRIKGRNAEAEPLLVKSLEIREKTLGANHPDYVRGREELAILYWKTQQWDKAYSHYKVVMDKTIDFINQYFPPMSEAEKTKYWDVTYPRFQRYNNFAIEASATLPQVVGDMFDYQTATKGLLLNATSKVKTAIVRSGNPQLINDYLAWLDQKEALARYYSLSREEIEQQKINLDSIEQSANRMEKSLSERSKDFSSGYTTQKVSFGEIKGMLSDQEAVVEIIHVRKYDQDFVDDARYVALVLTKAMDKPAMVVLDNGGQLETRYAKFYRTAIHQKQTDDHSYAQYWARIEPALQGKKSVFLSPDGVYNQMNVNTLKDPSGAYLLNKYDVTIVGNSKDLIAIRNRVPVKKKDAFLLGFPDYGGPSVPPLPGTKAELDGVSKLLKTSGYTLKQWMQKDASEANMKAVSAPALVHIATHGFFMKDTEIREGMGINLENAQENPLLRSGLLLAGASTTMSGTTTVDLSSNDNGVLTAYEAMNLNLDGTDLIVLSACETGLGDVKAGEGVYGLQRAFLVAGANAMVMSLWKVDDAATQQLMTNFYTNWLKSGNKQKAFKQAQQQLMTKYKDPYYWGAFVMMGM